MSSRGKGAALKAAPKKEPRPFVGRLNTLTSCRVEAARLYRLARLQAGAKIGPDEAYKLAALLQITAKLVEQSDTERRLDEIERLVKQQGPRLVDSRGVA